MTSPVVRTSVALPLAVLIALAAGLLVSAAERPIKIVADGKEVRSKLAAVERDQTVLVPVFEVAKALGYKPELLQDAKRITFCKDDVCLSIRVGDTKKDAQKVDGGFLASYSELAKVLGVHRHYDRQARTVTFTTKHEP